MKKIITDDCPARGGWTEAARGLEELDTKLAEETDYEIEFVKNQNRMMSLWNEIVQ
ncbi:hypothetical protein [Paenibacillus agricola]|uniref:Uncharacterized protein n=1 Tax=Paenibacillus agricola TaxID=2716264 RepID=A0ABX0J5I4_9BACL|nr:hypothetical protein [Paenibacillus agricola]NHN29304.1 hypothetical protein [Paenibacillus agricola]